MPVPSTITSLSTTAGSNSPAGSESPALIDDYLRAHAAFIATLRDGKVDLSGSYADPAWIASLSGAKLTAASVAASALASGSAKSNIGTGGITSNELASNSVTTEKFDAGAKAPLAGVADTVNDGGVSTSAKIADGIITPAKLTQPLTIATAKQSTSGTAIDFTGIPSWAKRVTVIFSDISTSGTSDLIVQLGDPGGIEITGYNSVCLNSASSTSTSSIGIVFVGTVAAANQYRGIMTLVNVTGGTWIAAGTASSSGNYSFSGSKTLSPGPLDRVRITTANGTDTFDAGFINILYE